MDGRALVTQDSYRLNQLLVEYLGPKCESSLSVMAHSAYRLGDPASTFVDTHILEIDFQVDLKPLNQHEQLRFDKAQLVEKEEWVAGQCEDRGFSADGEDANMFRLSLGTTFLSPASRRDTIFDGSSYKTCIVAVNLEIDNRRAYTKRTPLLALSIPYRSSANSPPLIHFNSIDTLMDNTRIPLGLPPTFRYQAQAFRAFYCHPEMSEVIPKLCHHYVNTGTHSLTTRAIIRIISGEAISSPYVDVIL
jgi:hypothetical protein